MTVAFMWGALGFVGMAVVGMLLSEVHESASIVARFLVGAAVRRLPPDMREVRREEWLAELAALEGLHILRLCRAIGYLVASVRLRERPLRLRPRYRVSVRWYIKDKVVHWLVGRSAEDAATRIIAQVKHEQRVVFEGKSSLGSGDWLRDIADEDPTRWVGGPQDE